MAFDIANVQARPHNHEVWFYSDDVVFVETVSAFVAKALKAGDSAIVFATKPHREMLLEVLMLEDIDFPVALRRVLTWHLMPPKSFPAL